MNLAGTDGELDPNPGIREQPATKADIGGVREVGPNVIQSGQSADIDLLISPA